MLKMIKIYKDYQTEVPGRGQCLAHLNYKIIQNWLQKNVPEVKPKF